VKIWAIWSGDYEGSDIEALFTDEKDARFWYDTKMKQTKPPYGLSEPSEMIVHTSLDEPREYVKLYGRVQRTGFEITEEVEYHFPGEYEVLRDRNESNMMHLLPVPTIRVWARGYEVERLRKETRDKCAKLLAEFPVLEEAERRRGDV